MDGIPIAKFLIKYHYRAAAFSGVRSFTGVATGGSRVCSIVACTGETKDSCGLRFESYENESTAVFEELTIIGTFPTAALDAALDADDSVICPLSLQVSIMPLEAKDYNYNKEITGDVAVHTLTLTNLSAELYTFGLWGRVFATDGEEADPPVEDSSTIQILSRSLFMSMVALIAYNHV